MISCNLNVEAGLPGCRNAFAERVALLRRAVGPEHKGTLEEGLAKTVSFIRDHVRPGTKGVAVFARGGSQPFSLPLQFRVPLPTLIVVDATPNIYHLVELKDTYHRYVIMLCTETSV